MSPNFHDAGSFTVAGSENRKQGATMHRVTLTMELSGADAYTAIELALSAMANVSLTRLPQQQISVTIETDDPDLVDIVREIAWEYDPAAVQHSLELADVS